MIIKKYGCKRFAGLKDMNLEFEDGLNVILGSNEAGKSTVVEGIHSVLFKSSKIGRVAKEDKVFTERFMPVPSGDSIDGELLLCNPDGHFCIKKEWGSSASSQLTMPDSVIIKNEGEIIEKLKEVLLFGEETYTSIFFSKQASLKKAIDDIVNSKEATSEISSLLRKAIMELDGISLDKLEVKIEEEIEDLFKRWDIAKNYPENNKGINNPYKVGVGKILESFYKKESIKLDMEKANEAEKNYEDVSKRLKTVEIRLQELRVLKASMEKLENDVTQRGMLQPKLEKLHYDMTIMKKVSMEWPQNTQKLQQKNEELQEVNDKLALLNEEKTQAQKQFERDLLNKNIEKVEKYLEELEKLNDSIIKQIDIKKDDIDELELSYNNMLKSEAMLKAGVIIGQLNLLDDSRNLVITKDLDEPVVLKIGDSFKAEGYVKLVIDGLLEMELKSGDMDFNQIRKKYDEYKNKLEEKLVALNVESIEAAKLNKEKLDGLKNTYKTTKRQLDDLLGESTFEELKSRLEAFGDFSKIRDLEVIEKDIKHLSDKKTDIISDIKVLDNNTRAYTQDYGDMEGLFEKIFDIGMAEREIKTNLDKLAPLPDEFNTPEEFRDKLTSIRGEYDNLLDDIGGLKDEYFDAEKNLPTTTFEEYQEEYKHEESLFEKRLERGKKLLKIKESFLSTKAEMDSESFTPVVKAFSKYINILTNGNFKTSEIDNDFNVKLENKNNAIMPINLLSSGTYDSVALALRLSILEYVLGENKGFLILDDCLVDLDPYRKEAAARLINELALNHQVIFTTCSPDTAQLLGGYLIHM